MGVVVAVGVSDGVKVKVMVGVGVLDRAMLVKAASIAACWVKPASGDGVGGTSVGAVSDTVGSAAVLSMTMRVAGVDVSVGTTSLEPLLSHINPDIKMRMTMSTPPTSAQFNHCFRCRRLVIEVIRSGLWVSSDSIVNALLLNTLSSGIDSPSAWACRCRFDKIT